MASYNGIILDVSGLSEGDTVAFGASVPASNGVEMVVLTAEVFGAQIDGSGTITGGFALTSPDISRNFCYRDYPQDAVLWKPGGASSQGVFTFCLDPINGNGGLFQVDTHFAYVLGPISSTDTIVVARGAGIGNFDAGSIRLIVRQWTGLIWDTGAAGPISQLVNVTQPSQTSGAISPSAWTPGTAEEFAIYNGFAGLGLTDPPNCTSFATGPSSIATDDVIFTYFFGYLTAFSSIDTATPGVLHTIPFGPFNDPPAGEFQGEVGEIDQVYGLKVGAALPCSNVSPSAIYVSTSGGHTTSPNPGGTFDPDTMTGIQHIHKRTPALGG